MTTDKVAVSQEARAAAYEIEAAFHEATNNPCTCATDEMGCPYCNAWVRAEKVSCNIIARLEAQARLAGKREERERCAKVAEHYNFGPERTERDNARNAIAQIIATAIREQKP